MAVEISAGNGGLCHVGPDRWIDRSRMLQSQHSQPVRSIESVGEAEASPETFQFAFQSALESIQRQYLVIAFTAAILIAMGLIYLFTTPPSYTATATMIIDTKRVQLFQQQSMFTDLPVDTGAVESLSPDPKIGNRRSSSHQEIAPCRGSRIHQPRRRTRLAHCCPA